MYKIHHHDIIHTLNLTITIIKILIIIDIIPTSTQNPYIITHVITNYLYCNNHIHHLLHYVEIIIKFKKLIITIKPPP